MITNIFDSHAHYDDEAFDADRDELLKSMKDNGVSFIMNAAYDMKSSQAAAELSQKYDFIYAAAGVHPENAESYSQEVENEIIRLLKENPKTKALGEIGLDYHYPDPPREIQIKVFERQLQIAKELNVPVIIHSREATEDTMVLLRKYKPEGILHCYSGSAETAKEVIKLGMYIGFTGVITFKNARKAVESAEVIPLDRLLVETDCPYMAPVPFRGKRCDSTMLQSTVSKLAEIKNIPENQLADITNNNAKKIFKIF